MRAHQITDADRRRADDAIQAAQDRAAGRTPGAPSPTPWRVAEVRHATRVDVRDARGGLVCLGARRADAEWMVRLANGEGANDGR